MPNNSCANKWRGNGTVVAIVGCLASTEACSYDEDNWEVSDGDVDDEMDDGGEEMHAVGVHVPGCAELPIR